MRIAEGIWEIHQHKLWEKTHLSFEDFIAEHFGYEKQHGYRLLKLHKESLRIEKYPMGYFQLSNERQAREIAVVPDEKLPKVIKKAQKLAGEKPTSRQRMD